MSAVAPATAGITNRLARLPVIGALLAYADDKATFPPTAVNDMIAELGRIALSPHPVMVDGRPVDPMAFAAGYLQEAGKRMTEMPKTGALRTEVRGELGGRKLRAVYTAAGRIGIGTGVPASIGARRAAAGNGAGSRADDAIRTPLVRMALRAGAHHT